MKSAGGIESQAKQLSAEEIKELIADVQSKGDPTRGEAIFRRGDTACMKCHAIAGAGGTLAPDLLSIGVIDEVITVSDTEAERMTARLSREEGLYVGPSSGANVHAAVRLAKRMRSEQRVVTILCDTGERYQV